MLIHTRKAKLLSILLQIPHNLITESPPPSNPIPQHNEAKIHQPVNKVKFQYGKTKNLQNPQQIIKYLKQASQDKKLFALSDGYQKLMELIKMDTHQGNSCRFAYYSSVKELYEAYVTEMAQSKSTESYNPYIIAQQAQKLSQLMFQLSKYPKFAIQRSTILSTYELFCRHLNHVSDVNMNKALLFVLRADRNAEQTVIFGEFLKYYLRVQLEVVKGRLGINIKGETLSGFVKKTVSGLVHRGFLRRSPGYDRDLGIQYPQRTLQLILKNPSTNQNLIIRKILYKQIFLPIVALYEQKMHSNLYNTKYNHILWDKLNDNFQAIFNSERRGLLEKQAKYLRELYVLLSLVLWQQESGEYISELYNNMNKKQEEGAGMADSRHQKHKDKIDTSDKNNTQQKMKPLQAHLPKLLTSYHFLTQQFKQQHQNSQITNQFHSSTQLLLQKYKHSPQKQQNLLLTLQPNPHAFNTIKYMPFLSEKLVDRLAQQLNPYTFHLYHRELVEILPVWTDGLYQRACGDWVGVGGKGGFWGFFGVGELDWVVGKLGLARGDWGIKLYAYIIQTIINRDYNPQPTIQQVLTLLHIYQTQPPPPTPHPSPNLPPNLKALRLFLFRYLSDHKNRLSLQQLQTAMKIALQLNDEEPFSDQQGHYEYNIFEELDAVDSQVGLVADSELRRRIRGKVGDRGGMRGGGEGSDIREMIKKIKL